MAFGQVISTSPFGIYTFTVSYSDNFDDPWAATQTDSFLVTINRLPFTTAAGQAYTFDDIDPDDAIITDYFDIKFPWVIDDYHENVVFLDSSVWFDDLDATDVLTYDLTLSDGTPRPDWIGFIRSSGEMKGSPSVTDASSYINLKFTAFDTK